MQYIFNNTVVFKKKLKQRKQLKKYINFLSLTLKQQKQEEKKKNAFSGFERH